MIVIILSGIAMAIHVSGFNEFTPYVILMIILHDKYNPPWITDKQNGF